MLVTYLLGGAITPESLFTAGIFCLAGFFIGTVVEQMRYFSYENLLSNEKFQKYEDEKKAIKAELKSTQVARDTATKKFRFLSEITHHDIFNNLSALIGSIDLVKTKITNEELLLDIDRSENIAYAIRHQIDFAKTYGRIGTSEPQWINVERQIQALLSSVPQKEVDVSISFEGLEIFVDPLFEMIFANLINNSLNFGVRVSRISISYLPFNHDIAIVYEDNGIGIHAVDKSKIFEKGVGKNPGFGLYLSREILSVTGLSIKECGVYGEGARFEIFVPDGKFRFV
jgi:signal transduction histidine kinase